MKTDLMKGKRGLVMGVANDHSIAWGMASALHEAGAEMAFTYQGEAFGKRVKPLAESIGSKIVIDCDVIQADGGTRCASISGGYVALCLAIRKLIKSKALSVDPVITPVCAVSCGVKAQTAILDLDYIEDSSADVDMNFVMTGDLKFVEVQGTAEHSPFSFQDLTRMKDLAIKGAKEIFNQQKRILK